MEWYALLPLVALASALTQQEQQAHSQYYGNHRRPCGEAQFSVLISNAENYTLRTTGIPAHTAFRTSPYRAAIHELVYTFPREPKALEHPLCVPNGVPIGFALDGVPFYNPLSKDWNNAIEGSCAHVFDRCGGNVDRNNQYYYSELPNFDQQCLDLNRAQEAVHIGVALDGFPIYYERRFNASTLDECGGHYLDTANKRFYRYVFSNQFPYTIGCFHGKVQNITTLTYCKGHEGEYGSLCACVNVGPPGMAVGYKWLEKDAVTVGQCTRRPAVQERERALICNRDEIPAPDFLEEDRRSNTCVDFRALYSLIVIQGHRGGLAPWTRLRNYGKEEDMEEHEEDSEYIRHFKALRWLLSDLHVLDYPELEKYQMVMNNRTKPLCPKEQRKLRNALAQIWVVAFLREAHRLRPEASDYEKEEVQRAFRRLMYVLKTLKALEISAYVKKPEKKDPMDPWGIWIADDHEEDHDDEEMKDEDKLGALISQLTALQTLGQLKEREKKDGKKSEGGDGNKEMRARLLSLLWEIQGISGDGKDQERHDMGRGEGDRGEEYGGGRGEEGENGKEDSGNGGKGKEDDHCEDEYKREGEGAGYGRGGMRREGGRSDGEEEEEDERESREEGSYGRRSYSKGGYRGMEREGRREGYRGMEGEGRRGGYHGMEGEGRRGGYHSMKGEGRRGGYHGMEGECRRGGYHGMKGEGKRGGYHGMEGAGEGSYRRRGGYGQPRYGCMGGRGEEEEEHYEEEDEEERNGGGGMNRGMGNGDCEEEMGPGGDRPKPRGGPRGSGQGDYGRRGGYERGRDHGYGPPRGGRYGPPRGGQGPPAHPPMGGQGPPPHPPKGEHGPPPPRDGAPPRDGPGGHGQCTSGGGRDQDPRDMMQGMMNMMRAGGAQGDHFQRNLDQILQLISYLRQAGDSHDGEGEGELPGRGERPERGGEMHDRPGRAGGY